MKKWKKIKQTYSTQLSMLIVLIVLCVATAFMSEYFLTATNLANIGTSMSVLGTIAAGLTVVMLMGGLDISQMSVMAVAVMAIGITLDAGWSPFISIILALLIGVGAGALNGFLITVFRLIPMIATIGTQMIFRAVAFITTSGRYIRINNPVFNYIGYETFLGIPVLLWIMAVIYVFVFIILKHTKIGREVYAIGSNASASFLSGIHINKVKMIAYMFCGLTSGLAAVLWSSQMSTAIATAGSGSEMNPVAAVVMGGISLSGGKGNIIGTFLGVTILTIFANAMVLLNISSYYQQLLNGVVLLLAVLIDSLQTRRI